MAASTITRFSWADDTGTFSAPNNDGTPINNAQLTAIWNAIDQMFAGAGSYATFEFGGLLKADGFGLHSLVGAGTGPQILRVGNTTAGTGNYTAFQLQNDADAGALLVATTTSTFTASGDVPQDGTVIRADRPGGLNLSASYSGGGGIGIIRFFTQGLEYARITYLMGLQINIGTFGGSSITPPIWASSQNNFTPSGPAQVYIISASTPVNLTGWVPPVSTVNPIMTLINGGSSAITVTHNDSSSTIGNRFFFRSGSNLSVAAQGVQTFFYSSGQSVWRLVND